MTALPPPPDPAVDRWLRRWRETAPSVAEAGAAVTIVLRRGADDVETLLIERAERTGDPASGQVALPGGHVDSDDRSLAAAALRELAEEVDLRAADLGGPPRYVRTLLATRFGLRVAVFAAALGAIGRPPRPADPREVAGVFWLPRRALEVTRTVDRDTPRGRLAVPATVFDGHILWGFTRRVLLEFFDLPVEEPVGSARPSSAPSSPSP